MIQDFTPDSRFRMPVFRPNNAVIFEEPVFQSVTEDRPFTETLYAEHRGFDQRTAMVTNAAFPTFATVFANIANRIITLQSRLFAVAKSL